MYMCIHIYIYIYMYIIYIYIYAPLPSSHPATQPCSHTDTMSICWTDLDGPSSNVVLYRRL